MSGRYEIDDKNISNHCRVCIELSDSSWSKSTQSYTYLSFPAMGGEGKMRKGKLDVDKKLKQKVVNFFDYFELATRNDSLSSRR